MFYPWAWGLGPVHVACRLMWPSLPGPVAALSLDADPLADAPKPTVQQIEQAGCIIDHILTIINHGNPIKSH